MTPKTKTVYVYEENAGRPISRQVPAKSDSPEQDVFTIGSTGDFTTLQGFFDYMTQFNNISKQIEAHMLSGFYIEENLTFSDVNLSNILLTGEDTETLISREYLLSKNQTIDFMKGTRAHLPILATGLRMDTSGTPYAGDNNFSNLISGFRLEGGSLQFANEFDPIMNGKLAGIADTMGYGIIARRAASVDIGDEAYVRNAGNLHGSEFTFTGGGLAFLDNIQVILNSRLNIIGGESTGSANNNITCTTGSLAYIQQTIVNGASNNNIVCGDVANVRIAFTDARNDGATEVSTDIVVEDGGIIQLNSVQGGTSQALNTITAAGLIIG